MVTTHLTYAIEVAVLYPDARPPENGLPWQSDKLGVDVLISDQNGCIFLIRRHDAFEERPSRLVRRFFFDQGKEATAVAVVECSGEAERATLLKAIQNTIIASLENGAENAVSSPGNVIDLDLPEARMKGERDGMGFHAVRSFFLTSEQEFHDQFVAKHEMIDGMGARVTTEGVMVVVGSDDHVYSVALIHVNVGHSWLPSFVRKIFQAHPNAYAWVVAFDDELLRDTFAVGLQQKVSELPPGGDGPEDDFQWHGYDWPSGGGDAGVPVATIRPKPTRSGSAAEEIPEDAEPTVFTIGPMELAETQTEGELAPARVTHDAWKTL